MAGATSESLGNLQLHDLSTYQPETLGRCTACVLPRTLRGIEFDAQGRCGVCRAGPAASVQHKSDDRPPVSLADWLADIRARAAGCSHDCVVGLSGGRDSTYLLYKLAQNEHIVLSRDKLLETVWGYRYCGDARTVDTHIKSLREHIGPYRKLIQTVWGVGYKFEKTDEN